jgi:hypothetical protein
MTIRSACFRPNLLLAIERKLRDRFTPRNVAATFTVKYNTFAVTRNGQQLDWLNRCRVWQVDGLEGRTSASQCDETQKKPVGEIGKHNASPKA